MASDDEVTTTINSVIMFALFVLFFVWDSLYVQKLTGFLITHIINFVAMDPEWRNFSVESISFAPLTGKIFFKKLKFFSQGFSLRCVDGYVSFTFWGFDTFFEHPMWTTFPSQEELGTEQTRAALIGIPCRAKIGESWVPGFVRDVVYTEFEVQQPVALQPVNSSSGKNNNNNNDQKNTDGRKTSSASQHNNNQVNSVSAGSNSNNAQKNRKKSNDDDDDDVGRNDDKSNKGGGGGGGGDDIFNDDDQEMSTISKQKSSAGVDAASSGAAAAAEPLEKPVRLDRNALSKLNRANSSKSAAASGDAQQHISGDALSSQAGGRGDDGGAAGVAVRARQSLTQHPLDSQSRKEDGQSNKSGGASRGQQQHPVTRGSSDVQEGSSQADQQQNDNNNNNNAAAAAGSWEFDPTNPSSMAPPPPPPQPATTTVTQLRVIVAFPADNASSSPNSRDAAAAGAEEQTFEPGSVELFKTSTRVFVHINGAEIGMHHNPNAFANSNVNVSVSSSSSENDNNNVPSFSSGAKQQQHGSAGDLGSNEHDNAHGQAAPRKTPEEEMEEVRQQVEAAVRLQNILDWCGGNIQVELSSMVFAWGEVCNAHGYSSNTLPYYLQMQADHALVQFKLSAPINWRKDVHRNVVDARCDGVTARWRHISERVDKTVVDAVASSDEAVSGRGGGDDDDDDGGWGFLKYFQRLKKQAIILQGGEAGVQDNRGGGGARGSSGVDRAAGAGGADGMDHLHRHESSSKPSSSTQQQQQQEQQGTSSAVPVENAAEVAAAEVARKFGLMIDRNTPASMHVMYCWDTGGFSDTAIPEDITSLPRSSIAVELLTDYLVFSPWSRFWMQELLRSRQNPNQTPLIRRGERPFGIYEFEVMLVSACQIDMPFLAFSKQIVPPREKTRHVTLSVHCNAPGAKFCTNTPNAWLQSPVFANEGLIAAQDVVVTATSPCPNVPVFQCDQLEVFMDYHKKQDIHHFSASNSRGGASSSSFNFGGGSSTKTIDCYDTIINCQNAKAFYVTEMQFLFNDFIQTNGIVRQLYHDESYDICRERALQVVPYEQRIELFCEPSPLSSAEGPSSPSQPSSSQQVPTQQQQASSSSLSSSQQQQQQRQKQRQSTAAAAAASMMGSSGNNNKSATATASRTANPSADSSSQQQSKQRQQKQQQQSSAAPSSSQREQEEQQKQQQQQQQQEKQQQQAFECRLSANHANVFVPSLSALAPDSMESHNDNTFVDVVTQSVALHMFLPRTHDLWASSVCNTMENEIEVSLAGVSVSLALPMDHHARGKAESALRRQLSSDVSPPASSSSPAAAVPAAAQQKGGTTTSAKDKTASQNPGNDNNYGDAHFVAAAAAVSSRRRFLSSDFIRIAAKLHISYGSLRDTPFPAELTVLQHHDGAPTSIFRMRSAAVGPGGGRHGGGGHHGGGGGGGRGGDHHSAYGGGPGGGGGHHHAQSMGRGGHPHHQQSSSSSGGNSDMISRLPYHTDMTISCSNITGHLCGYHASAMMDLVSNLTGSTRLAVSPEEFSWEGENVRQRFQDFANTAWRHPYILDTSMNLSAHVNNVNVCLMPDAEDATQGAAIMAEKVQLVFFSSNILNKINLSVPGRIVLRPVAETAVGPDDDAPSSDQQQGGMMGSSSAAAGSGGGGGGNNNYGGIAKPLFGGDDNNIDPASASFNNNNNEHRFAHHDLSQCIQVSSFHLSTHTRFGAQSVEQQLYTGGAAPWFAASTTVDVGAVTSWVAVRTLAMLQHLGEKWFASYKSSTTSPSREQLINSARAPTNMWALQLDDLAAFRSWLNRRAAVQLESAALGVNSWKLAANRGAKIWILDTAARSTPDVVLVDVGRACYVSSTLNDTNSTYRWNVALDGVTVRMLAPTGGRTTNPAASGAFASFASAASSGGAGAGGTSGNSGAAGGGAGVSSSTGSGLHRRQTFFAHRAASFSEHQQRQGSVSNSSSAAAAAAAAGSAGGASSGAGVMQDGNKNKDEPPQSAAASVASKGNKAAAAAASSSTNVEGENVRGGSSTTTPTTTQAYDVVETATCAVGSVRIRFTAMETSALERAAAAATGPSSAGTGGAHPTSGGVTAHFSQQRRFMETMSASLGHGPTCVEFDQVARARVRTSQMMMMQQAAAAQSATNPSPTWDAYNKLRTQQNFADFVFLSSNQRGGVKSVSPSFYSAIDGASGGGGGGVSSASFASRTQMSMFGTQGGLSAAAAAAAAEAGGGVSSSRRQSVQQQQQRRRGSTSKKKSASAFAGIGDECDSEELGINSSAEDDDDDNTRFLTRSGNVRSFQQANNESDINNPPLGRVRATTIPFAEASANSNNPLNDMAGPSSNTTPDFNVSGVTSAGQHPSRGDDDDDDLDNGIRYEEEEEESTLFSSDDDDEEEEEENVDDDDDEEFDDDYDYDEEGRDGADEDEDDEIQLDPNQLDEFAAGDGDFENDMMLDDQSPPPHLNTRGRSKSGKQRQQRQATAGRRRSNNARQQQNRNGAAGNFAQQEGEQDFAAAGAAGAGQDSFLNNLKNTESDEYDDYYNKKLEDGEFYSSGEGSIAPRDRTPAARDKRRGGNLVSEDVDRINKLNQQQQQQQQQGGGAGGSNNSKSPGRYSDTGSPYSIASGREIVGDTNNAKSTASAADHLQDHSFSSYQPHQQQVVDERNLCILRPLQVVRRTRHPRFDINNNNSSNNNEQDLSFRDVVTKQQQGQERGASDGTRKSGQKRDKQKSGGGGVDDRRQQQQSGAGVSSSSTTSAGVGNTSSGVGGGGGAASAQQHHISSVALDAPHQFVTDISTGSYTIADMGERSRRRHHKKNQQQHQTSINASETGCSVGSKMLDEQLVDAFEFPFVACTMMEAMCRTSSAPSPRGGPGGGMIPPGIEGAYQSQEEYEADAAAREELVKTMQNWESYTVDHTRRSRDALRKSCHLNIETWSRVSAMFTVDAARRFSSLARMFVAAKSVLQELSEADSFAVPQAVAAVPTKFRRDRGMFAAAQQHMQQQQQQQQQASSSSGGSGGGLLSNEEALWSFRIPQVHIRCLDSPSPRGIIDSSANNSAEDNNNNNNPTAAQQQKQKLLQQPTILANFTVHRLVALYLSRGDPIAASDSSGSGRDPRSNYGSNNYYGAGGGGGASYQQRNDFNSDNFFPSSGRNMSAQQQRQQQQNTVTRTISSVRVQSISLSAQRISNAASAAYFASAAGASSLGSGSGSGVGGTAGGGGGGRGASPPGGVPMMFQPVRVSLAAQPKVPFVNFNDDAFPVLAVGCATDVVVRYRSDDRPLEYAARSLVQLGHVGMNVLADQLVSGDCLVKRVAAVVSKLNPDPTFSSPLMGGGGGSSSSPLRGGGRMGGGGWGASSSPSNSPLRDENGNAMTDAVAASHFESQPLQPQQPKAQRFDGSFFIDTFEGTVCVSGQPEVNNLMLQQITVRGRTGSRRVDSSYTTPAPGGGGGMLSSSTMMGGTSNNTHQQSATMMNLSMLNNTAATSTHNNHHLIRFIDTTELACNMQRCDVSLFPVVTEHLLLVGNLWDAHSSTASSSQQHQHHHQHYQQQRQMGGNNPSGAAKNPPRSSADSLSNSGYHSSNYQHNAGGFGGSTITTTTFSTTTSNTSEFIFVCTAQNMCATVFGEEAHTYLTLLGKDVRVYTRRFALLENTFTTQTINLSSLHHHLHNTQQQQQQSSSGGGAASNATPASQCLDPSSVGVGGGGGGGSEAQQGPITTTKKNARTSWCFALNFSDFVAEQTVEVLSKQRMANPAASFLFHNNNNNNFGGVGGAASTMGSTAFSSFRPASGGGADATLGTFQIERGTFTIQSFPFDQYQQQQQQSESDGISPSPSAGDYAQRGTGGGQRSTTPPPPSATAAGDEFSSFDAGDDANNATGGDSSNNNKKPPLHIVISMRKMDFNLPFRPGVFDVGVPHVTSWMNTWGTVLGAPQDASVDNYTTAGASTSPTFSTSAPATTTASPIYPQTSSVTPSSSSRAIKLCLDILSLDINASLPHRSRAAWSFPRATLIAERRDEYDYSFKARFTQSVLHASSDKNKPSTRASPDSTASGLAAGMSAVTPEASFNFAAAAAGGKEQQSAAASALSSLPLPRFFVSISSANNTSCSGQQQQQQQHGANNSNKRESSQQEQQKQSSGGGGGGGGDAKNSSPPSSSVGAGQNPTPPSSTAHQQQSSSSSQQQQQEQRNKNSEVSIFVDALDTTIQPELFKSAVVIYENLLKELAPLLKRRKPAKQQQQQASTAAATADQQPQKSGVDLGATSTKLGGGELSMAMAGNQSMMMHRTINNNNNTVLPSPSRVSRGGTMRRKSATGNDLLLSASTSPRLLRKLNATGVGGTNFNVPLASPLSPTSGSGGSQTLMGGGGGPQPSVLSSSSSLLNSAATSFIVHFAGIRFSLVGSSAESTVAIGDAYLRYSQVMQKPSIGLGSGVVHTTNEHNPNQQQQSSGGGGGGGGGGGAGGKPVGGSATTNIGSPSVASSHHHHPPGILVSPLLPPTVAPTPLSAHHMMHLPPTPTSSRYAPSSVASRSKSSRSKMARERHHAARAAEKAAAKASAALVPAPKWELLLDRVSVTLQDADEFHTTRRHIIAEDARRARNAQQQQQQQGGNSNINMYQQQQDEEVLRRGATSSSSSSSPPPYDIFVSTFTKAQQLQFRSGFTWMSFRVDSVSLSFTAPKSGAGAISVDFQAPVLIIRPEMPRIATSLKQELSAAVQAMRNEVSTDHQRFVRKLRRNELLRSLFKKVGKLREKAVQGAVDRAESQAVLLRFHVERAEAIVAVGEQAFYDPSLSSSFSSATAAPGASGGGVPASVGGQQHQQQQQSSSKQRDHRGHRKKQPSTDHAWFQRAQHLPFAAVRFVIAEVELSGAFRPVETFRGGGGGPSSPGSYGGPSSPSEGLYSPSPLSSPMMFQPQTSTSSVVKMATSNIGVFIFHGAPLADLPDPDDWEEWADFLSTGTMLLGGCGNLANPIPDLFQQTEVQLKYQQNHHHHHHSAGGGGGGAGGGAGGASCLGGAASSDHHHHHHPSPASPTTTTSTGAGGGGGGGSATTTGAAGVSGGLSSAASVGGGGGVSSAGGGGGGGGTSNTAPGGLGSGSPASSMPPPLPQTRIATSTSASVVSTFADRAFIEGIECKVLLTFDPVSDSPPEIRVNVEVGAPNISMSPMTPVVVDCLANCTKVQQFPTAATTTSPHHHHHHAASSSGGNNTATPASKYETPTSSSKTGGAAAFPKVSGHRTSSSSRRNINNTNAAAFEQQELQRQHQRRKKREQEQQRQAMKAEERRQNANTAYWSILEISVRCTPGLFVFSSLSLRQRMMMSYGGGGGKSSASGGGGGGGVGTHAHHHHHHHSLPGGVGDGGGGGGSSSHHHQQHRRSTWSRLFGSAGGGGGGGGGDDDEAMTS